MESIRFKEAEDDCTEALDLDDRYIKAYSRRITARKELSKFKEAMDGIQTLFLMFQSQFCCLCEHLPVLWTLICTDAEFAVGLDPNNPELRKQYSDVKTLHMEVIQNVSSYILAKHC
jgi:RNA polymerase II-associated protein 3